MTHSGTAVTRSLDNLAGAGEEREDGQAIGAFMLHCEPAMRI